MSVRVETEKELAEAMNRGEDTIEIVGDLSKKTLKIRATGNVSWAIALMAIGVAFYSFLSLSVTRGASAPVAVPVGAVASGLGAISSVGILGAGATYSAIAIAVAAGSVGVLTKIREYKELSRSENNLILKKI